MKDDINRLLDNNKKVYFCTTSDNLKKQLKEDFDNKIKIVSSEINQGFIVKDIAILSTYDLEEVNDRVIKYKNTYHFGKKLKSSDQLEKGDYVVHVTYGICQYVGMINLTKNGISKDYIQLDFAGNDKIYVPVEKINNLYKYGDTDGTPPKLNKLNSTTWAKTKAAIKKKINDIS